MKLSATPSLLMRFTTSFGLFLSFAIASLAHAAPFAIISLSGEPNISVYALDESKSVLSLHSSIAAPGKPGALCVNRAGTRLYAVMKGTGTIAAFAISEDLQLTPLGESQVDAGGSYLRLDPSEKFLLSSFFADGKVAVIPIDSEGRLAKTPHQMFKTDQRAHAIVTDPSGKFVFVPHTLPNAIHQFHFDPQTGLLSPNETPALLRSADVGPRHLWFHPTKDLAFGSDEKGRSITSYHFDPNTGRLSEKRTLPSQPTNYEGKSSTSDIEIHPSGKFVYIANRGYDYISCFSIDETTGDLTPLERTPTEATTRSFNISLDGRFLVAAGQKSGGASVFKIDDEGRLTRTQTLPLGNGPWWVQFVDR